VLLADTFGTVETLCKGIAWMQPHEREASENGRPFVVRHVYPQNPPWGMADRRIVSSGSS
jgi:hypothetical protein